MRQVFSSPRLENTEAVAQMLREAGIEVRITNGRSYKGGRRGTFRYTDKNPPQSAVWVVKAEDQTRARAMLREAGLIDSTRGEAHSYRMPSFRSQADDEGSRRRNAKIRMFLLAAIAIVLAMSFLGRFGGDEPAPAAVAPLAPPPFDGRTAPTLAPIARAVLAAEIPTAGLPVVCLAVDGQDAPPALVESLLVPGRTVAPSSACVRDDQRGAYHRRSGRPAMLMEVHSFRPSAPDAGTVQLTAFHQPSWGEYKTLAVGRVDGQWRVVRTVKHVVLQG